MAAPPPEDCALHVSGLGVQGECSPSDWCRRRRPPRYRRLGRSPGGYDHLGGGGRLSHIRQLRQHRVVGLALRHLPLSAHRESAIPATTSQAPMSWTAPSGSRPSSRRAWRNRWTQCVSAEWLWREFRMPAAGPTTCMKVSTGLSSCPEPAKTSPEGIPSGDVFGYGTDRGLQGVSLGGHPQFLVRPQRGTPGGRGQATPLQFLLQ